MASSNLGDMAQNARSTPGRKKPRAYDPVKVRAAVLAQFGLVREVVEGLSEEQLARPGEVGERSVRELAARAPAVVESVVRSLAEPARGAAEVNLLDWPFAMAKHGVRISEDGTGIAGDAQGTAEGTAGPTTGVPVAELYARAAAAIAEALPGADGDRVVPTRVGAMRFADFLVTRAVELVVHSDDLARATGVEVPFDRQALAACTRLLADALAVKAPGASTEVRIPPFAVVQCVAGPRHTRGTPPNVVETDPLTWVRLATGRTQWAAAVENAQVSASGERADLVGALPILG